ncbi:MAG: hypothetical protein JWN91_599 [Nocardioides sp.]|jgi:uncharacterized membrane-anchored protein|nr:hypothetical protein [Nocardioides sp.]
MEPLAAKVPEITALFWVIKILTTGMGEAASDGLGETSLALGGIVGVGGFFLALWLQLRSDRYHAPTYWFCVSMVAVFGTIMADILHVATGLSYYVTSTFYAAVVAALFFRWYRSEGTLSIHHVDTRRRERFYWATVLATFALGTAVGDLVGLTLHLGFLQAGLLFLAAMLVPLVAWRSGVNATLCFWTAYVLTRPLGASFADWIGKDHEIGGGLGFGDLKVTAILVVVIAALVAWAHRSGHDIQKPIPVDG